MAHLLQFDVPLYEQAYRQSQIQTQYEALHASGKVVNQRDTLAYSSVTVRMILILTLRDNIIKLCVKIS